MYKSMLKSLLHISTVVVSSSVVLMVALAASPASQEPAPAQAPAATNPVKPTAESQAKAKKTYGYDCALCHGASGDGKTDLAKDMQLTLSDLTDPKTLAAKSDADIFAEIRNGKEKMPPEAADRARDADVWNLVIYVRGLAKTSKTVAQ